MNLTQPEKTLLKAHMQANTNLTPATDANGNTLTTPFVINTRLNTRDPDDETAIAAWYNKSASLSDNQPFANINVWNPFVTLAALNSAINWSLAPLAATASPSAGQITNAWLQWQSMTWGGTSQNAICLDMSDPQVRKGVLNVWGDVASPGNASLIAAIGCGQRVGTNAELVLANAVAGASQSSTGAYNDAHPLKKDVYGNSLFNQKLTQPDVDDLLQFG